MNVKSWTLSGLSGLREVPSACGVAALAVEFCYSNRLRENGGVVYGTNEAIFEAKAS